MFSELIHPNSFACCGLHSRWRKPACMTMSPLVSSALDSLRCSSDIFPSSAPEELGSTLPRSVGGTMPEFDCLCSNKHVGFPAMFWEAMQVDGSGRKAVRARELHQKQLTCQPDFQRRLMEDIGGLQACSWCSGLPWPAEPLTFPNHYC